MVRLMAVAIKIAGIPIGVSFSRLVFTFALDTPPVKFNAVLMPIAHPQALRSRPRLACV
jgi:hypothetical protein